jgi:superfamily II DNA/RNA helicase
MPETITDRDLLAEMYFEQLPYTPYPVQEEALLSWFTEGQGVLVCAPTGTGKTLIAEAAMFEVLHSGKQGYYTTPLIALTDQKFDELQRLAVKWGFDASDVGLVTGNRRVNPDARVLVVVAEILLNRLLHTEAFDFTDVAAVVMDEFHSFNDRERGIVWELSLALLPAHVRTLLLSATVGNAYDFTSWLRRSHQRDLKLVEGRERKVPLSFQWVGDKLLDEQMVEMAAGDEIARRTPSLLFCFNRDICWAEAEMLKGKKLIDEARQRAISDELDRHDWSQGAGPKLKAILQRGIGVHHAGVLPKYRRIVEELYQRKLLAVCVCTETLSAGINLPARSVVLPTLLKGPPDKKVLIDPSTAHQIFGRAGRPQFDTQGFVYALAHEDDVKIARWKEKYDQIPEDTKDPGLMKAKKALKKKQPTRRTTEQYWNEQQFQKLIAAPPAELASRGPLPWRLLAYMLDVSPEVAPIRELVSKRLLPQKQLEEGQKMLDKMLITLWKGGYVELEPKPTAADLGEADASALQAEKPAAEPKKLTAADLTLGGFSTMNKSERHNAEVKRKKEEAAASAYRPKFAHPTERLPLMLAFRSVNPLYGVFLINQLGIADRNERLQAMESVLEMPGSVARYVRVPKQEFLPPGPLARERLDDSLLRTGLATAEQLGLAKKEESEEDRGRGMFEEERVWVLTLADKLKLQFDFDFPSVHDVKITPVWVAGELLEFGGDFNKLITSKGLQKQEGMIFRHLLRLILLIGEFHQVAPADTDEDEWRAELDDIADRLTTACAAVDPQSTEQVVEQVHQIESRPADL